MIAGVAVEVGSEAVVVSSHATLRVLSSAVHRGGFTDARAIVNLHVSKHDPCMDPEGMIGAFAHRAGVAAPWVGLLTGAHTERAVQVEEAPAAFTRWPSSRWGSATRWPRAARRWRPGSRRRSTRSWWWTRIRSRPRWSTR